MEKKPLYFIANIVFVAALENWLLKKMASISESFTNERSKLPFYVIVIIFLNLSSYNRRA